jgi:hypothetical protein
MLISRVMPLPVCVGRQSAITGRNIVAEVGICLWEAVREKITNHMEMAVFLVVAPFRLVEFYWRFIGACCLHHQGDDGAYRLHGATTRNTVIFILAAVRTSNLTYGIRGRPLKDAFEWSRPEQVNQWSDSMTARWWWGHFDNMTTTLLAQLWRFQIHWLLM